MSAYRSNAIDVLNLQRAEAAEAKLATAEQLLRDVCDAFRYPSAHSSDECVEAARTHLRSIVPTGLHPGDWLMRPHKPGRARNVCRLCQQMTEDECNRALGIDPSKESNK